MSRRLILLALLLLLAVSTPATGQFIYGGGSGGSGTISSGTSTDVPCYTAATTLGPCDTGNAKYASSQLSVPTLKTTGSAGSITVTDIAAPSAPSAGSTAVYVDSTSHNICAKNTTGTFCGVTGGIASGTSGGIPYFSSTTALSSTALLTANKVVVGAGAGTAPFPGALTDDGTTVTLPNTAVVNPGTSSGGTATVGGTLFVSMPNSNVGSTGSFVDFASGGNATLKANSFNTGTRCVQIEAYFTTAATGNTKAYQVLFGSTTLVTRSDALNNGAHMARAVVCRTGSNTQNGFAWASTSGATITFSPTTPNQTDTSDITIKVQGNMTTATTDMTLRMFRVLVWN